MRFAKGADVHSAQGERLGTLSRVIIDPNTRKVTHIVVEKGLMFTTNKIIPIDHLDPQNQDKIVLNSADQDLSHFQDFEEAHYVDLDTTEYPANDATKSFWYPPVDYAWWRTGMPSMAPIAPALPVYSVRTTQNIPEGTVALEEGAKVISADHKHVGSIEQLVVDPQDHRVSHFIIGEGFLFKERKLIPVTWIATIAEKEVHLSVNSGTLERLPAFHPTT
jgi:uncharacterized protein YrrD